MNHRWMGTKTLLCGGLMLAAVAFAAEPIPCTLDVASEGTDVLLSVPSDGNVDVNLVCSSAKTTPGALELALSAFTGDEGSVAAVLSPAQAPAGAKPQLHVILQAGPEQTGQRIVHALRAAVILVQKLEQQGVRDCNAAEGGFGAGRRRQGLGVIASC